MKNILLDTSFLIECVKNKIDIHTELSRILNFNFEVAILDKTHHELETIAKRSGRDLAIVKLAKTILRAKKVQVYTTNDGHTDTHLLKKAGKGFIIATMDIDLKKKLKEKGCDVIIIRSKKILELIRA